MPGQRDRIVWLTGDATPTWLGTIDWSFRVMAASTVACYMPALKQATALEDEADVMHLDDLVWIGADGEMRHRGIAEIYSVPRIGNSAEEHQLKQGWALDKLTGWDFTSAKARKEARQLLEQTKPKLLVGSPCCTLFSSLMNLGRGKMDPEEYQKKHSEAILLFDFALELYQA